MNTPRHIRALLLALGLALGCTGSTDTGRRDADEAADAASDSGGGGPDAEPDETADRDAVSGDSDSDGGALPDGAGDTDTGDADEETELPDAGEPSVAPPDARGPFVVGHTELRMPDTSREPPGRATIGVWYPAASATGPRTRIAFLFESGSYDDAPPADGAFPLVMFSHGSNGANFQSFSLYEHLASHGFVVAAPDHAGNRIADSPSDEEMAAIALRRPGEVMRAMATVEADARFGSLVTDTPRAITGHSFGGYTAIVLAGGAVDVAAARQRCEDGDPSDVFCPSLPFWDVERVEPPAGFEVFDAAIAFAPGGYAAFGDAGLSGIEIPVFLMGGTDDEFTASDIRPLFAGLPSARLLLLVQGGGHLMFTDICRLPGMTAIPELAELCDPSTHIDAELGWRITNTYAAAFLRAVLLGDEGARAYLGDAPPLAFDEATLERAEFPTESE